MAKSTTTKVASFSASEVVLDKARKRANETERGNFSAYVERLIIADLYRSARQKGAK